MPNPVASAVDSPARSGAGPHRLTRYLYQNEIAQMMFVFGETGNLSSETTMLVEDIVHAQVIELVSRSEGGKERDGLMSIHAHIHIPSLTFFGAPWSRLFRQPGRLIEEDQDRFRMKISSLSFDMIVLRWQGCGISYLGKMFVKMSRIIKAVELTQMRNWSRRQMLVSE